uniref:Transmembrane protein n=1 Tax=Acrobeloides nanus TaxID=290746 RepID=A0A914E8R2_9BILA
MDWINLNDERWNLLANLVVLFNLIPGFIFMAYLVLTSMVIISSALLAELFAVIFGLAVLLPVLTFCTLSALSVGGFLVIVSSFMSKPILKNLAFVKPTIKQEQADEVHIHSD